MTAFALFIAGLLLLLFGSLSVITNVIRISVLTKISPLIIGITIVAIGTSLPEMVVSVFGGLDKAEGLALGNIIGSNIANIGLILGISLLMRPLYIDQTNTQKNMLITLVVSLALFVTLLVDGITVLHGFIFVIVGCGVILWQILRGKSDEIEENLLRKDTYSPALTLFSFFISLLALFIGGKLLVDGGIAIATSLHVPQAILGITAVAIGTSIPELAVSIAAFTKKTTKHEEKLVIGNILARILHWRGGGTAENSLYFRCLDQNIREVPP